MEVEAVDPKWVVEVGETENVDCQGRESQAMVVLQGEWCIQVWLVKEGEAAKNHEVVVEEE